MKNLKPPNIGARNFKTALAVFLCIFLFDIINRPYPFYACIAAVICMKGSINDSLKIGKNRMIGSSIGGIIGLILTFIVDIFKLPSYHALITGIGIIAAIYLCNNVLKKSGSVTIACILVIAIMENLKGNISYLYALNRIIDTFIGIIIAILVNKYIYNYEKKLIKQIESDIKSSN